MTNHLFERRDISLFVTGRRTQVGRKYIVTNGRVGSSPAVVKREVRCHLGSP